MPSLRDDITEARARADVARKALAKKLAQNQTWTRDDKIMSIDGLDSLVSMADETLPYIPNGVVGGSTSNYNAGPLGGDRGDHFPTSLPDSESPNPVRNATTVVPKWTANYYAAGYDFGKATIEAGKPLALGTIAGPTWPNKPKGFDASRPNLLLDGDRRVWNHNDVDYTGDNSGSDKREGFITVAVQADFHNWGDLIVYAVNDGGDNRITARGKTEGFYKVIECRGGGGGQAYIPITLQGPPRGGTQDWVQVMIEMVPYEGSKSVTIGGYPQFMQWVLPNSIQSHFRVCNVMMGNGEQIALSSVYETHLDQGFLRFMGDHGYPVQIINDDDVVGFWFNRMGGAQYDYTVHTENGHVMRFKADDLPLVDGRFHVVRDGVTEGWLDADRIRSITPTA